MANITLHHKTDQDITFQYYEANGTTTRSLVDATVFFTLKKNSHDDDADDSNAILKKTVTVHTSAGAGLTTISLTDTDTNIRPKNYFYDIKVKEANGLIYKATSGSCRVEGSPTNRIS